MIERYLLRYFLAVVDQGNFSRAAGACNVSQPTLSAGIAKLEQAVETQLFIRSNQRVQLTEAGARFLVHARRIEREFNEALQAMGGSSPRTVLRMGVLGSVPGALLSAAFAASKCDPDTVEFVFGTERELLGQLGRGRIEVCLGLVDRGGERFLEEPLMAEGYSVVMPASHFLADKPQVTAEELSGETMIVRRHCEALSETSRHFLERGVRPHFALRSTNDERVMQMVCAGLGVTVMPDCYRADGMASVKMAGFDLQRMLGFQYAHDAEHLQAEPHPLLDAVRVVLGTQATGVARNRSSSSGAGNTYSR